MPTVAILSLVGGAIVFALLVYPGELSHINSALNRWLYNRSASDYERKWASDPYQVPEFAAAIERFALGAIERSGAPRVLDLGCGTGRGIRLVLDELPADAEFIGVDFSASMLREFQAWIERQPHQVQRRIQLIECDLARWNRDQSGDHPFGLVLMLEVGEFVPSFVQVLRRAAEIVSPGGGIILTRPAGLWSWVFFHRFQSRQRLANLMVDCGFDEPDFMPWRSRYEIVFATRQLG